MKLQIERTTIETMAAAFPHLAPLMEQLRFGDKVEVNLAQLAGAELDFLRDSYRGAVTDVRRPPSAISAQMWCNAWW
ncbi:hypothetical protein [Bradyrhizobium sp. HKCCYLRH1062]|uniref:hypothetical protein n=1 Tax=unclassified Bradyrhizobium TaxID=2631580 RepID=UPI003EBCF969